MNDPIDPAPSSPLDQEGFAHSPKSEGDNAGGESTASERRSPDKGHQRAPRPGDRQGGH